MKIVYKKFDFDLVKMTEDLQITIVFKDMMLFTWHQLYAQGDFDSAETIRKDFEPVVDAWKKNHMDGCKGLDMGGLDAEELVVDFDAPPRGSNDLLSKPPILEEILNWAKTKRVEKFEEKKLAVSFAYNNVVEELMSLKNK